jgi:hypothetical protein
MNFSLENRLRWLEWNSAMSIHREGLEDVDMFRRDSHEEDALIAEANNIILDNLSNADSVGQIKLMTGKDLRSQISIEQAEELHREKELRGFSGRN